MSSILAEMPLVAKYKTSIEEFAPGIAPRDFLHIAGPCAIESEDSLYEVAELIHACGVRVLRGGAYKHRTLPYSFSGLGENGLRIHKRVANAFGMLTISEVMEAEQLECFVESIDIVQVGSRNMRNYFLLRHVATMNRPVLLKRDMAATLREWLGAAEHLLHLGVKQLVLCERGVRWHDPQFRNLLDLNSLAWIKTHLSIPVISDPSHGCGHPELMSRLSLASAACGADGLMIEVHNDPSVAKCDAEQAMTVDQYVALHTAVEALRAQHKNTL